MILKYDFAMEMTIQSSDISKEHKLTVEGRQMCKYLVLIHLGIQPVVVYTSVKFSFDIFSFS